jgi:hypothetical protein
MFQHLPGSSVYKGLERSILYAAVLFFPLIIEDILTFERLRRGGFSKLKMSCPTVVLLQPLSYKPHCLAGINVEADTPTALTPSHLLEYSLATGSIISDAASNSALCCVDFKAIISKRTKQAATSLSHQLTAPGSGTVRYTRTSGQEGAGDGILTRQWQAHGTAIPVPSRRGKYLSSPTQVPMSKYFLVVPINDPAGT